MNGCLSAGGFSEASPVAAQMGRGAQAQATQGHRTEHRDFPLVAFPANTSACHSWCVPQKRLQLGQVKLWAELAQTESQIPGLAPACAWRDAQKLCQVFMHPVEGMLNHTGVLVSGMYIERAHLCPGQQSAGIIPLCEQHLGPAM